MANEEGASGIKRPSLGLIILIIAALVAAVAIAIALTRSDDITPSDATANAPAAEAPDVDTVIANLEKKLQEEPDNAEGWRMLGWSYFETERFAEAATAMKRATTLDPENAEYFSMLGEALVLGGNNPNIAPDARAAFARALELDPEDARARYFVAAAKDIDGKHTEAIDDWFALLADTPADAPYAEDIRRVIRNVGKERGIEVEKRLAGTSNAPPPPPFKTTGPDVATGAIPGPTQQQMRDAAQLPQGQQEKMIRDMVEGLDTRLSKNPNDARGWIMLMRSRVALGETAKAQKAYTDAQRTFRNNGAELKQIKEAAAALGIE
ncbi:tetratricopeptide repeat protein [Sphingorhabdus sp. Alg239-R122]|uniref:tetratricopeptide repeat protein n=1 Tax=Sphingorhabdus sp. Alg239-R122 TaxID=2305989 RepID=UPI0013D9C9FD|nr:tetratricopeptide repeat protein [Sphingorhabdus sp. Alg239-R122]